MTSNQRDGEQYPTCTFHAKIVLMCRLYVLLYQGRPAWIAMIENILQILDNAITLDMIGSKWLCSGEHHKTIGFPGS